MFDSPTFDRPCVTCLENTPQTIAAKEMQSGRHHYQWYCFHGHTNGPFIPKEEALHILGGSPPYRIENESIMFCQHCEARGAEAHHIAPKHLFEDADTWPLFYLCTPCHGLWHKRCTPHKSEIGIYKSALGKAVSYAEENPGATKKAIVRLQQLFNELFLERS